MNTFEEFCQEFAGNWTKFDSFAWFEKPARPEEWGIYHTEHRDSGLIDRANAEAIYSRFDPDSANIERQHFHHWAVGWIDALAIRVYDAEGNPTPEAEILYQIKLDLANYPILDEEIYNKIFQQEEEEAWANWLKWDFRRHLEELAEAAGVEVAIEQGDQLRDLFWELAHEHETCFEDDGQGVHIDVRQVAPSWEAVLAQPLWQKVKKEIA